MGLFKRSQKKLTAEEDLAPVITVDSIYRGLDYLIELIKQIHPSNPYNITEAKLKFKALFLPVT